MAMYGRLLNTICPLDIFIKVMQLIVNVTLILLGLWTYGTYFVCKNYVS